MLNKVRGLLDHVPHKRFVVFCIGGGLGAIINWIISFIITTSIRMNYIIWWDYLLAYSLAQIVNVTFNFLWNRHITFKVKSKLTRRLIKFIIVSGSTATLSIFLVYTIKEFVVDNIYKIIIFGQDLNYLAAIIIVTFIVAVLNYLLNKLWVFKVK